ncbi:MAG TPA: YfhO family protein [Thermoanaerobaculia bacterium]|nr:YfhO family protein [Thermoanaerobaculia bacterium]
MSKFVLALTMLVLPPAAPDGFQWELLLWMLACAGGGVALWNRSFRPRLEWKWACLLIALALAPLLPALRAGAAYGPFDTNVPRLPWATREQLQYQPKGGALNDVTLQFAPWQAEARRQLLSGRIPLLNPYSAAGQSLLGNGQAAPCSLVSILALPFAAVPAQALRAFLKLLLALAGTFLAARQLACRPVFCLAAGLGYAFGGSLTVWQLFPHGEVIALWPLVFLATERLVDDPDQRSPRLLLLLALGAVLLAGHPETALMTGLAFAARLTLASPAAGRRGELRRLVLATLGAALLALLCTAFFTLPVAQTVLGSEKLGQQGRGRDPGAGRAAEEAGWGGLVNMVSPGIFGTPQRSSEHGPAPLHWLAEGSVGLPCLILAAGGVLAAARRRRTETYLAALAAAAFAIHLNLGGLPGRVFALPLVSAIDRRYLAYLGGFAVALLAARALEQWCAEAPSRRRLLCLWGSTLLAGLAAAVARAVVLHFWRESGVLAGVGPAALAEAALHWTLALAAVGGTALCLSLRRFPLAAGLLAGALTLGQLLAGYCGYVPVVSARLAYPALPVVEAMKRAAGPFRVVGTRGVFAPSSSTVYGLADIRTHDPTESARYVDWLVDLLDLDRSTYKKQYRRPLPGHEPFLRLLGTRFLLARSDLSLGPPWVDRGLFRETRLWELAGEVRWAFFPGSVIAVSSPAEARRLLRGRPDAYELATLEGAGGAALAAAANGRARVRTVRVEGDRLEIGVEVAEAAWLVVAQAAIPGWRARADGQPAPTAIADGALLAVRVPAGARTVTLRYLPRSFLAGLALSSGGLLIAAATLWRRTSRSRPQPPAATAAPTAAPSS